MTYFQGVKLNSLSWLFCCLDTAHAVQILLPMFYTSKWNIIEVDKRTLEKHINLHFFLLYNQVLKVYMVKVKACLVDGQE